ncbi:extracellular solute-binding protein [Streptococcus oralis]|uniref:ABC-type sugar transport system, periplasmic component n=1 Tax=Streptococcus oralis TaxID=1303 RepID=A0A139PF85_STROR|nr:extracellular solute-binding protein [Streptococcus oralis]KXT87983.1 ABC-type sugar transport system, periplasmic component [Streptococcus oralis]
MVTIKDIAKMAGVSHGTASNVLNKKGNVSTKKIQLVEAAAAQLGYQLNAQAQLLRKRNSDQIILLLPVGLGDKYQVFLEIFTRHFYAQTTQVEPIYVFEKKDVDAVLERLIANTPKAIVCCGVRLSHQFLSQRKPENLYSVDFWGSKKLAPVTNLIFDHSQTLQDLSDLMDRYQITDLHFLTHKLERDRQFIHDLENYLDLDESIAVTRLHDTEMLLPIFNLLKKAKENTLILSTNETLTQLLLDVLKWNGLDMKFHLVTIGSKQLFHDPQLDAIELDIERVAEKLALMIESGERQNQEFLVEGIYQQDAQTQFHPGRPVIRLLTIESPMTEALRTLTDKYRQSAGVELRIDTLPYHTLYDLVTNRSPKLEKYDLIRLDVAWLRSIDLSLLKGLDSVASLVEQFDCDVFSEYIYIDDQLYTLPLDSSMQLLFYRRDLFEDTFFQRRYYEETKKQFQLPQTFAEFDALTAFFRQESIQKDYDLYGHTISDHNPILSYSDFIPRLKEKIKDKPYSEALFKETLDQYGKSRETSLKNSEDHWRQVADNFAKGKTAMEIIYSNYAFRFLGDQSVLTSHMIGVADLPGSSPLLGGGCLAVLAKEDTHLAEEFLSWLYSDQVLQMLAHLGGFIVTKQLSQKISLLNSYPWLKDMTEKMSKGSRFLLGDLQMTFEAEREMGARVTNELDRMQEQKQEPS